VARWVPDRRHGDSDAAHFVAGVLHVLVGQALASQGVEGGIRLGVLVPGHERVRVARLVEPDGLDRRGAAIEERIGGGLAGATP